jgi:hypothetical protein
MLALPFYPPPIRIGYISLSSPLLIPFSFIPAFSDIIPSLSFLLEPSSPLLLPHSVFQTNSVTGAWLFWLVRSVCSWFLQRFGTAFQYSLQRSNSLLELPKRIAWQWKMEHTLRNIPEERRPHLRRGGSLKSLKRRQCFLTAVHMITDGSTIFITWDEITDA